MVRCDNLLHIITTLGILMVALITAIMPYSTALSAENASRPNVLLIITDDHAWTDYSFMQHPHVATPRIDGLARESLTFRRGYVPSSLCCPSLAQLQKFTVHQALLRVL